MDRQVRLQEIAAFYRKGGASCRREHGHGCRQAAMPVSTAILYQLDDHNPLAAFDGQIFLGMRKPLSLEA
jgi:hypothetical protein